MCIRHANVAILLRCRALAVLVKETVRENGLNLTTALTSLTLLLCWGASLSLSEDEISTAKISDQRHIKDLQLGSDPESEIYSSSYAFPSPLRLRMPFCDVVVRRHKKLIEMDTALSYLHVI